MPEPLNTLIDTGAVSGNGYPIYKVNTVANFPHEADPTHAEVSFFLWYGSHRWRGTRLFQNTNIVEDPGYYEADYLTNIEGPHPLIWSRSNYWNIRLEHVRNWVNTYGEGAKDKIVQYFDGLFLGPAKTNQDIWIDVTGNRLDGEARGKLAAHIYEEYLLLEPECETCGERHSQDQTHIECCMCESVGIERGFNTISTMRDSYIICNDCMDNTDWQVTLDIFDCADCGDYQDMDDAFEVSPSPRSREHALVCQSCYNNYYFYCDTCCREFHRDYRAYISDDGDEYCESCFEDSNDFGTIHPWNYRPDLNFHPWEPADGERELYIGMEIEVSWSRGSVLDWRRWIGTFPEEVMFAKGDSSVSEGFEVVTHPMQPRWALENFPFGVFEEGIRQGMRETHESTGTHIHMNKEAFTAAHLWKFMQLHMRMKDFCGTIGGRGSNNRWGSFESDLQTQRKRLMEVVKKKGAITDFDRYTAINLRNEYTIEMRYMRGGTTPEEIKKNIEWALALYEYSDLLKVEDFKDGALDDPGFFLQWITDNDYPALQRWLKGKFPVPKTLRRFQ